MAINDNVKALTDEHGCIKDGQLASYVRCSMENKNLLQNKYDIYVGTGNYVGEIDVNGKYVSRETEGMNIIDALNAATTISGASAININSDKLKVDYSTSESAVNITSTKTIDINGTTGINLKGNSVGIMSSEAFINTKTSLGFSATNGNINIAAKNNINIVSGNMRLSSNYFLIKLGETNNTIFEFDGSHRSVALGRQSTGEGSPPQWATLFCGETTCSRISIRAGVTVIDPDSITTAAITATTGNITCGNNITLKNSSGEISALAITATTGNITCGNNITLKNSSGEISALSFNAASDARLKTNIKPFDYHDSILDVPVREYDWKESGEHAIGFVAQELQEVYPELVSEGEDGMLRIKETKLVYLLMEEVKKLKKEVEDLKKEG